MGEPPPATPTRERPLEDRLDSWKEIAAYLKRDVTTVQRWEKREGMPVHRHLHDRMGSVYASRAELDAWTRRRNLPPAQENNHHTVETSPPPPQPTTGTRPTRWTLLLTAGRWWLRWPSAPAYGSKRRSTSGEVPSRTLTFRRSRTSMDWSRGLQCHATAI